MSPATLFERLIPRLYDAALDDLLWPPLLSDIEAALNATNIHLLVTDPRSGFPVFGMVSRYPECNAEYIEDYAALDERYPRILRLPHATPTPHETLMTVSEIKTSPTYNEFLARLDAQEQTITRMNGSSATSIIFSAIRDKKRGPFNGDETAAVRSLLPHVRRSVQIRQALAHAQAVNQPLTAWFERSRLGVLWLDRDGRLLECNSLATEILAKRDGLFLDRGRLKASYHRENNSLQKSIGDAILQGLGGVCPSQGFLVLSRPSLETPISLLFVPLPSQSQDFGARRPVVAVLLRDPEFDLGIPAEDLARLYGLSHAEACLAAALVRHTSLKRAATSLAITEGSARTYLKRIFAKTGVHSQVALMKLLLTTLAGGRP